MKEFFDISGIPAALYGKRSDKVFLFVHGQFGCKEEAERFAEVANPLGWQVLAIDLPEHGGRQDGVKLLPWEVVPELQKVMQYAKANWQSISLRATSIGSWFSLLAFKGERLERRLLVSPLLDMADMISGLMQLAGVSEESLEAEEEIPTEFGQTLSWDYLCYARSHPVSAEGVTDILYGECDETIPRRVIDGFIAANPCTLTVMPGGEHWFHTPEQLEFMKNWEHETLSRN